MNYARRLARRLSTRSRRVAAPKKTRRNLFAERLEERSLLAGNVTGFLSDYYNQSKPCDVNADGEIAPLDALLIINKLNATGGGKLTQGVVGAAGEGSAGRLYVDTSNDGEVAPLDALLVINNLNNHAEGELAPQDIVQYEVRALLPGTNTLLPNNTVSIGQQFDLQIRVNDLRLAESPANLNNRGVFSAFADILFDHGNLFTPGVSEIQTVTVNSTPASGTFTLTFKGQTTAPIALNDVDSNPLTSTAVALDMKAKLEALSTIGAGNVLVDLAAPARSNTTPAWDVRFTGTLLNADQPLMTSNDPADITIAEINPNTAKAVAEAFRSIGLPNATNTAFLAGTGSDYQNAAGNLPTIEADRFNEVGAGAGLNPTNTGLKELARIRLIAGNVGGTVTFTPDFSDIDPGSAHFTTIYSSPGVNPVALGVTNNLPGRVTGAGSTTTQFTASGLVGYPIQPAVGDQVFFTLGPAANPSDQPPAIRTITAYDAATGTITVDSAFPGVPRAKGENGALIGDAFQINLAAGFQPIDLVGTSPDSVTVTIVTGPYEAVDDTVTGTEDQAGGIVKDVLANDTTQPPTGQTKNIVSVTQPALVGGVSPGTVTFTPAGNVTFTPASNFNGQAVFTYTGRNITAGASSTTDTANVTVTVTAVNDAPTLPSPGNQSVGENGGVKHVTLNPGPGGGQDEASQVVTVTILNNSNPGAVTASLNGNDLTLTGVTAGSSTVTLQAVDNGSPAATTTVTFGVTVGAVNDPPDVTGPATETTDIDVPLTLSAANGNKLSVTDPDAGAGSISVVITSSNGTIQGGSNNTRTITGTVAAVQNALDTGVTYVPPAGFDGNATLTVVANDNGNTGDGGPQTDTLTVTITVKPAVPKPIADNDSFSGATEDTPFTVAAPGVLDGDTDPVAGRGPLTAVNAVMPANFGTVALNPDGSFTYNPAQDFNGTASFTYRAQATGDGTLSNPATVTITVGAVNDAPVANPDTAQIIKLDVDPVAFAKQPIDVLANDTDVDTAHDLLVVGTLGAAGHGTVEKSADGKRVLFTPNAGYEGPDSFTYTASDGSLESQPTVVTVNVVNFAPKDVAGRVLLAAGNGTFVPLANIEVRISGKDFNHQDLKTVLPAGAPGNNTGAPLTVLYLTTRTDANGNYVFPGMAPPETSYKLTEVQPALFVDGPEVEAPGDGAGLLAVVTSVDSPPSARKDEFTLTWPIVDQTPLTGLNFIENGLDFSQLGDVTTAEQTAKAGPDGFWLAADIANNTLWSFSLSGGWLSATSLKLTFNPANLATATLTVGGLATSTGLHDILIHQNPAQDTEANYPAGSNITTPTHVGPRFRVYGNTTTGPLLFRIDGSAAEFGLAQLTQNSAAGGEGEGTVDRDFANAADALFAGGSALA